jgi:nicotinamide-nucleotide amidase
MIVFISVTITQINKDQALVPSKCTVLHNAVELSGNVDEKKILFISLPGVPKL